MMKLVKIILIALCVGTSISLTRGIIAAETPEPFIYEIHPQTLYLVTLEYTETQNNKHLYEAIPETPQHSKNICAVKPEACYRPASGISPPTGVNDIE